LRATIIKLKAAALESGSIPERRVKALDLAFKDAGFASN